MVSGSSLVGSTPCWSAFTAQMAKDLMPGFEEEASCARAVRCAVACAVGSAVFLSFFLCPGGEEEGGHTLS